MNKNTKCYSVNLSPEQVVKLQKILETTGQSQNKILSDAVGYGIKKVHMETSAKKLYIVRVRIDTALVGELGEKLKSGELDMSQVLFTYCVKEDPSVGVNLWSANDREHFEKMIAPHKKYYKEIIDVREVVTPAESLKIILSGMR